MYIYQIQEALQNAGYSPGPLDDIAGPQTVAAIVAFQTDHGLEPDGLVGPYTHDALFQDSNPIPPPEEQLSTHFNRQEFKCCCDDRYCDGFPSEMQPPLLARLEAVRQELNSAIIVTSGVRCTTRNRKVGGIPNSKHLTGYAVDCFAPGLSIQTLAGVAQQHHFGVILYEEEGFCHLEI